MKMYKDMHICNQSRTKTKSMRVIEHLGFDTETLFGKLHLICVSDKNSEYTKNLYIDFSLDNEDIIYHILNFLTLENNHNKMKWFYNLDYDVRAILRWLPEKNISELYLENKTKIGIYDITFLPKKFLRITKNKRAYIYYDVMQFFPGGLDINAKKYLNENKDDKIDSEILGKNKKYWLKNLDDIIKYCIQDCKITAKLADLLYENFWSEIKFNPKKPFSCGSIAQEYFINNSTFIPQIKNIPEKILRMHQNNYRGGRIEIFKKGYRKNLTSYDIKSAYPAEMIKLLDYSCGIWKKTNEYDDKLHGIYKIKYDWFNDYIGLFAHTFDQKTIYPNSENMITTCNEQELIFLDKMGKYGDYEIIEGYQFIPYKIFYPYRDLILKLFNEKEKTDDENKRLVYKTLINSIYGKTAQAIWDKELHKYKTGKLYNPIYCNRITSMTRCKIIESCIDIGKYLTGISTDSILSSKKIKKNIGNNLGEFQLEYTSKENLILMSGVRYNDEKQKVRGLGKKLKLCDDNFENKNKNKTYSLEQILKLNKNLDKINVYVEKPVTIFQGLKYKDYTCEDINVFMPTEKIIDINGDTRRLWFDDFKNAEDALSRCIDSSPIYLTG